MTQLHIRGQRGWNCFLQDQKYLDVGKHLLHIKVITSAYNLGQTDQFGMSSQCVCVCFSTSSGTALPASLWLSAKVKLFLQLPLQILELKIDHRAVFNSSPLQSGSRMSNHASSHSSCNFTAQLSENKYRQLLKGTWAVVKVRLSLCDVMVAEK